MSAIWSAVELTAASRENAGVSGDAGLTAAHRARGSDVSGVLPPTSCGADGTPSPLPAQLGCELDESGAIVIDDDGRTNVPAVFAAGEATTDKKAVVLAAAAGSRAAYSINAGLARGLLPAANRSEASA